MEPVYSTRHRDPHVLTVPLSMLTTRWMSGQPRPALEVKIDRLQDRYQAIIHSELSWQRRARVRLRR